MNRKTPHTNHELIVIKTFVSISMVSRSNQHVHDTRAGTLLTELHLYNSVVNGLSSYLSSEHVEFTMGNFEIGSRIFML